MSRTKRGAKGPGYEYWSRDANSGKWITKPGRWAKKILNRMARRKQKQRIPDD